RGSTVSWPDNAPGYAQWKAKKYGVFDQPNIRTGQMLSQQSLIGRTQVEADQITMVYGTGMAANRSATGQGFDSRRDDATDVEKARFAHEGQSRRKVQRPFYELDETISQAVKEEIAEALQDYLETATL